MFQNKQDKVSRKHSSALFADSDLGAVPSLIRAFFKSDPDEGVLGAC